MDQAIEHQLAVARALRTQGDSAGAIDAYRIAATAATDPLQRAHALRHLGEILAENHRTDEALAAAEEAVALYRDAPPGARLDLANALRVRAIVHEAGARTENATADWREARGLYAALGLAEGVAECDAHLPRRGR